MTEEFEQKLEWFKNMRKKEDDDKDSFETGSALYKCIKDRIFLSRKQLWDGCPLVIDWDENTDWDGLANEWPLAVIYINVPFSMTATWIAFALK